MTLTKKAVEFNTWAWVNYRELHECCMFYGYQMPDVPEWGNEEVRCADIPALVRKVAIAIALRTYAKLEAKDVNDIYSNIIYYGILEFRAVL